MLIVNLDIYVTSGTISDSAHGLALLIFYLICILNSISMFMSCLLSTNWMYTSLETWAWTAAGSHHKLSGLLKYIWTHGYVILRQVLKSKSLNLFCANKSLLALFPYSIWGGLSISLNVVVPKVFFCKMPNISLPWKTPL